MSDRIRFELSVPVATRPDSVGYIACCTALDGYSQGPTEDVAVRNLLEALELFLASLLLARSTRSRTEGLRIRAGPEPCIAYT